MNPELSDEEEASVEGEILRDPEDHEFNELLDKTQLIILDLEKRLDESSAGSLQKLLFYCDGLRKEIAANKAEMDILKDQVQESNEKLMETLKLSQVDQDVIAQLKKNVESAWKEIDAAQSREQVAQEQLFQTREKLEKIEEEARKFTEKKDLDEDFSGGLAKHKEGILKERDRLSAEVEELNRRLQIQRVYTDEIEKKRVDSENKNRELYKILDETSSEAFKEKRLLDSIRNHLAEVTQDRDKKIEEMKAIKAQNERFMKSNVQQNLQILAVKTNLERMTTHHNLLANKLAKATAELDQLTQSKDKIQHDLNQKINLLRMKEDEYVKLKQENNKLVKLREGLMKKLQGVQQAKHLLDQEMLKVSNQLVIQEKENESAKKIVDKLQTKLGAAIRERDMLRKDLVKSNRIISERNDSILVSQQEIKNLQGEIKANQMNEQKQRAQITKIEMERDRNAEETQILEDRVDALQDEIRLKDNYILELKNSISEVQAKLIQMQGLFETARTERNNFQRSLHACTEERNDLKEKLATSSRQIEQMKEEIANKEADLMRANKSIEKLEKDKQHLKIEVHNTQVILQNTRSELKEKRLENDRLYKTLADDEAKIAKLKKQYDIAVHEKDMAGSQMIRRNDEISLLNEKLQIVQMALDRGETQYSKRLDDIRLLKIEIANLRSQRNMLSSGLANTADMRQEVLQLHRVLNQERIRSKALEDEMLTPMNVHRWRTLGGKDPEKMDLVCKVQTLQKRILSQTVAAADRETDLQEAHKLYLSLKQFMLNLPSYKVKERLNETQRVLVVKNKKLKALMAELNAKEIDEKAKECMVEDLKTNLENTKKELVKEKKKKEKLLEERDIVMQLQSFSPQPPYSRTMGSGFKVQLST